MCRSISLAFRSAHTSTMSWSVQKQQKQLLLTLVSSCCPSTPPPGAQQRSEAAMTRLCSRNYRKVFLTQWNVFFGECICSFLPPQPLKSPPPPTCIFAYFYPLLNKWNDSGMSRSDAGLAAPAPVGREERLKREESDNRWDKKGISRWLEAVKGLFGSTVRWFWGFLLSYVGHVVTKQLLKMNNWRHLLSLFMYM